MCVCVCVCVCVRARACVCILGREENREFASRAVVVVVMTLDSRVSEGLQ